MMVDFEGDREISFLEKEEGKSDDYVILQGEKEEKKLPVFYKALTYFHFLCRTNGVNDALLSLKDHFLVILSLVSHDSSHVRM